MSTRRYVARFAYIPPPSSPRHGFEIRAGRTVAGNPRARELSDRISESIKRPGGIRSSVAFVHRAESSRIEFDFERIRTSRRDVSHVVLSMRGYKKIQYTRARCALSTVSENLFPARLNHPRHRYKEFPFFARAFLARVPAFGLYHSFSLAFVCALFRARGETRLLRDVQCAHTVSSLPVVLVVAEGRRSREMPEKEREREREDERLNPSTRANGERDSQQAMRDQI